MATHHSTTVVVTGIGLVSGLGLTREVVWKNVKDGRCAVQRLERDIGAGEAPFFGCPIPGAEHGLPQILWRAAEEAALDAQLMARPFDKDRAATLIGLSKGDLRLMSELRPPLLGHEPRGSEPSSDLPWTLGWPNSGASLIARKWDLRGPCIAPVAACATGLVAVLQGADLIRRGVCDLAVAGSADSSLDPLILGAFRKMRVLARCGEDPSLAVRPWDRARTGFVVGEGSAVFILESEAHARGRGAMPYAEVAGGALGSDAYHMTDLNPDPANLAGLIQRALCDADVAPCEVDHVNVHGTATRANDPLECRAIRRAFGPAADGLSCSANKPQIGHLLGAAGSAELAMTCLAIRDRFAPPTLNLTDPEPACDLDGTPGVGRARPIRAALKLSIGFGGHLAVAVLRRPEGPSRQLDASGEA